jgi:hypothetical protein
MSRNLSKPQYLICQTEIVKAPTAYGGYEEEMGICAHNDYLLFTVGTQEACPCETGQATIMPFFYGFLETELRKV